MKCLSSVCLILLLLGCGEPQTGGVSLSIVAASATQEAQFLNVDCAVVLENRTASSLTVTSSFFSAFDSLTLVVSCDDGRQIASQGYVMHQSPFSIDGRPFVLPPGRTTKDLRIPVFPLTNAPERVRLQLVGHLPRSTFSEGLTSDIVRVAVK